MTQFTKVSEMKDNKIDELVGKIKRWAYARRIIQESTSKDQFLKAVEEMGELSSAIAKRNREEAVDAFGDVLVCLINAAEIMGIGVDEALQHAYDEIKDRRGVMFQGVFVKEGDSNYERIIKQLEEGYYE